METTSERLSDEQKEKISKLDMETTSERLSDEQKEKISKMADDILNVFDWNLTTSGEDYWEEVYLNLEDLGGKIN